MELSLKNYEFFRGFTPINYKNTLDGSLKKLFGMIDNKRSYEANELYLDVNFITELLYVLHLIDLEKKCGNYIDTESIISSIGCGKIKDIFNIFKYDADSNKLKIELKSKLKAFINDIKEVNSNGIVFSEYKKELLNAIDEFDNIDLIEPSSVPENTIGGNNKITRTSKKEILGKERCIYKKSGDRKEYVKYKGGLITVKDFKKLMKSKDTKHK